MGTRCFDFLVGGGASFRLSIQHQSMQSPAREFVDTGFEIQDLTKKNCGVALVARGSNWLHKGMGLAACLLSPLHKLFLSSSA